MNNQRLRRLLLAVALGLVALARLHAAPPAALTVPAAPGAMGSSLTLGPDGTPWLSWLEPAGSVAWALKCSRFDAARQLWGEPRLITQGTDFFINWADFPQLAIGHDGRLTAVWFINNPAHHAATVGDGHHGPGYRAIYSYSTNGGATWSPELPVSDESLPVEFVALQPLADGRLLAAWLDGRNRGRMALYARVLDGRAGPGPDTLVDDSVCDCCQLSFVANADGGALLAYRGRTQDEIRDIHLARFDGRDWSRLGSLHADAWKIAGCPVNGPQLAAAGGHGRCGLVHRCGQPIARAGPTVGRWRPELRPGGARGPRSAARPRGQRAAGRRHARDELVGNDRLGPPARKVASTCARWRATAGWGRPDCSSHPPALHA
jgi:hypothetical protein